MSANPAVSAPTTPTVPSSVTPETPLADLNLDWRERDLPERERTKHVHRLHPYLGKFIPQLAEVFLRKYFRPGQTVADPFCGSGTTLVQANELGIHAVGYDISAFNVLLSRVKTARYDLQRLEREVTAVMARVKEAVRAAAVGQMPLWQEQSTALDLARLSAIAQAPALDQYLRTWYAPQALQELLIYRHFAEAASVEYPDVLRVILSRAARSARLTTHFNLDFPKRPQTEPYWCHKHSRVCAPTTGALKFLERYSVDTVRRIKEYAQVRTKATVVVHHADCREAIFPPIAGVITSPPYVGLIDYHDQHAYAYHLLGLEDRRGAEIGAAARGAGRRAREQYAADMVVALQRALEAMPPGGPMIIIAADRANLYPQIAQALGVEVEGELRRHVNRRTGLRTGGFYESAFIWRKRA